MVKFTYVSEERTVSTLSIEQYVKQTTTGMQAGRTSFLLHATVVYSLTMKMEAVRFTETLVISTGLYDVITPEYFIFTR
jgi:hypothetical protein